MKPIEFEGANAVYGEGQEQYSPLPALQVESPDGAVITAWKLSFWERVRVLLTGRIWSRVLTFGNPLQPMRLDTRRKGVE